MSTALANAALYDGYGTPITPDAPPWDGMIHARPVCTVFFNYGDVFDGAVDLIWATPAGDGPLPIPADVLGEIITVLDRHGAIAMHAASYDAIDAAIGAFLPLAGGGRA